MSEPTTSSDVSPAISPLAPGEKIKAGNISSSLTKAGFGVAVLFGAVSLWLGAAKGDHWKRFFYAYVTAWTFAISILIGCLFFVIIHHLTRSRWSTVIRRLAEICTLGFPLMGIAGLGFILPIVFGNESLYFWSTEAARHDHHLRFKLGWLAPGFFAIRFAICIGVYAFLGAYFTRKSRQQDETGDPALSDRMRWAAGPGVIVFAFTTFLFSFDIVMSLAPKWYSTMFGVNIFAGAMIGAYAFLTLLSLGLQRTGRLTRTITTEHYHDFGKWLWAYTFFWAYTAFSQFMLFWYANIPEETLFYKYRMFGGWSTVSIILVVCHWAIPFLFLMSRWTKRITPVLAGFAVWQLAFHWLDLYWNIMPNYQWSAGSEEIGPLTGNPMLHTVGFSPVDITLAIAMVGILIVAIARGMKGNLVPTKDPTLALSVNFENY